MKRSGLVRIFSMLTIGIFFLTQCKSQDSAAIAKYYPKAIISRFGLLGGPSYVTVQHDHIGISVGNNSYFGNEKDDKYGYSFGVSLEHDFTKHFKIESRILWERKGYREISDSVHFSGNDATVIRVAKLNTSNDYLTFLLLPQFVFGERSQINFGAGAYSGYLKQSTETIEHIYQVNYTQLKKGDFLSQDYGLVFNIGYTRPFIKRNLAITFQFTYSHGISPILDQKYLLPGQNQWYNRSYSLLFGIKFLKPIYKLLNLKR